MYKILPILLFSVSLLFAIDYSEEIQKHIDFRINDISEEIMIGLNQNIYSIEIEYEVIDTIIVDEIITRENYDSLITSEIKERLAQLRVEIPTTDWLVSLYEIENTPIILLFKFQCNPFIDKQLEYNSELRHHKRQLSTTIENFNWCQEKVEDSSFTFIDIIPTEEHKKAIGQTNNLNRNDIYDDSWALIIGIDKYQNVRSLDYAVKDAEDVQSLLVDKFHFQRDNIVLLKDEEATKASILQEFSNITKKAGANDRVLIFFAGHGDTEDLPDGGEIGYLLPVDGNNTDLYISAIKMDEIQTISLRSEAKHILYLIDACYGGIATVGARGLDAQSTPDYLQKITQYKSRQIISAGGRGEEVIEKSEWGHSAFTKNLLTGLRDSKADTDSDGIITAQELGVYLKKKVTIDSNNLQTPKTRNLSNDEGEFVFVYAQNSVVIQDKSADEKLDYLISEMEEMKSQNFSGDETIVETAVDGENSFFKKYGYERHGMSFVAFEDVFTVGYSSNLNKNWRFSIAYASLGNKTYNRMISVHDSHSLTSKGFAINLNYNYYITDKVVAFCGGGTIFNMMSWQDTERDKSGNYQLIFPSLASGLAVYPFQLVVMGFQMNVGISSGFLAHFIPATYEIDAEDLITTKDWRIIFSPLFSLEFEIPKK